MNIEKKFGEKVRALRKQLNISQEELSFRSGLHKNYVSDVECGRRNVSLKAIAQFAEGLEISIKELMDF
jgi:transcriptional regulator with XRE-family HTH domain